MYKCKKCGFVCASHKIMDFHNRVEDSGLTEFEYMKIIRDKQKKSLNNYLKSKE